MQRKAAKAVLLLLAICILSCAVNVYSRLYPEHLIPYLEESLIDLAARANGSSVALREAPLEYQWLLLFGFTHVDARDGTDGAVFGFDRLGMKPEESFQIEYYSADRLVEQDLLFSSLTEEAHRITGIGMNGAGYISLARVKENWLFRTIYLPT